MKILVISILAHGHLNMCIGICQELLARGHRVCFTVDQQWKGKLAAYGFEEAFFENEKHDESNSAAKLEEFGLRVTEKSNGGNEERIRYFADFMYEFVQIGQKLDKIYDRLVKEFQPDVVLSEDAAPMPYLERAAARNIPWVKLNSCAPLVMEPEGTPPCWCGLNIVKNPDKAEWTRWRELRDNIYEKTNQELRKGRITEKLPEHKGFVMSYWSPYLNIYNYPEVLNYFKDIQLPYPTLGIDCLVDRKKADAQLDLPTSFQELPGKTIYLSMGTLASINSSLMQKLVDALAKNPNKFIVSKGANGDQLKLASNMWGQNYLPQTKVLSLVDLAIAHGGNNTLTECFYYGVPMIVLPFFSDQPDNAMRIEEFELGMQLDPFTLKGEKLNDAVNSMLANEQISQRMREISKSIRQSRSLEIACDRIQSLCKRVNDA